MSFFYHLTSIEYAENIKQEGLRFNTNNICSDTIYLNAVLDEQVGELYPEKVAIRNRCVYFFVTDDIDTVINRRMDDECLIIIRDNNELDIDEMWGAHYQPLDEILLNEEDEYALCLQYINSLMPYEDWYPQPNQKPEILYLGNIPPTNLIIME